MGKRYGILGVGMALMSILPSAWAANPCMPIAQACMQEGFYKGGHESGKGLVEDCVMPVVQKTKTLPNNVFTDEVLTLCGKTIQQKMEEKAAGM